MHLCLVKTGNNFVDDVLKRLVSPATNKLSWNLLKHNNLFKLLKISECHSMNWHHHRATPHRPLQLTGIHWCCFLLSSELRHYLYLTELAFENKNQSQCQVCISNVALFIGDNLHTETKHSFLKTITMIKANRLT